MGSQNSNQKYKSIDKENTKLNIFMYDPQNDINNFTFLNSCPEEEKKIKDIEIYKHNYFSIKFYRFKDDLNSRKIKKIVDLIKQKKESEPEEYQNLIIYIEQKKENYNKAEKTYFNLLKEIIKFYSEDQPLFLFVQHDENITKEQCINYLNKLYEENPEIYNKIDWYSLTVLKYDENNFKNKIFNEIWDAVSFYNQIPYITFPSLDSNFVTQLKNKTFKYSSSNLYTLNLLLVGDSGAGKSTFINIIKGKKIAYESSYSAKKTIQINEYLVEHIFNNNNRQIKLGLKLVDTLGFSTENIEKEKLLNYTKEVYYEGVRNKDKIHVLLYFINADNVERLLTPVQIDFLNFIMNEDKDLKIIFLINKSLLPKKDKNGHIIESKEKRIFKQTIKKSFKNKLILSRLIEKDENNIIELNLKYNERTKTKPFGIKNFINKLYLLFNNNYINFGEESQIKQEDLYNCFFLRDLKSLEDIEIKIKKKSGAILNSFLLLASIISYIPIPFLDNAFVFFLDIAIINHISNLFGYKLTANNAKKILQFILFGKSNFNLFRILGFTIKIIDLVGDGVKFIPMIGIIIGGAIVNVANVGEMYFVFKQTINYYFNKIKEEQYFIELLINLSKYYNENIEGLKELYNIIDDHN